jgi:ATP-binding protein involved in chromosome partitioning
VLSAVTANDGKVFFLDQCRCRRGRGRESVALRPRRGARHSRRHRAMIALTAERKPGSASARASAPAPHLTPACSRSRHRPPQSPASPMSKQSEIPGIAL